MDIFKNKRPAEGTNPQAEAPRTADQQRSRPSLLFPTARLWPRPGPARASS
jgi:hypothetical protein